MIHIWVSWNVHGTYTVCVSQIFLLQLICIQASRLLELLSFLNVAAYLHFPLVTMVVVTLIHC
jgi:hypothetical protein